MIAVVRSLACVLLLLFGTFVHSTPLTLKFFQTDSRYSYRIDLLKLALDKTAATDGPYLLSPITEEMTQARGLQSLEMKQGINIAFLSATTEREARFLSVKVPILQGILGYRIAMIHRRQADVFAGISSLNDLRQLNAGFGSHWADLSILKANQLPVTGVARYPNLFSMLSAGRFDYFPRGINEIYKELEERKPDYPQLTADRGFALYYPYPVFFYVSKDNQALANRLQRGLEQAKADGSFDRLFMQYHREVIKQSGLKHRRIFILNNPDLPADLPLPNTGRWLKKAFEDGHGSMPSSSQPAMGN